MFSFSVSPVPQLINGHFLGRNILVYLRTHARGVTSDLGMTRGANPKRSYLLEPHQEISHELGVVVVQVEHGLHAVGLAMQVA